MQVRLQGLNLRYAHGMREKFANSESEAALLVDAMNAFNTLNRTVALHNMQQICPALATIQINTYREPARLFCDGDEILSQEGTTQGDPLAMPMYALATIPLMKKLQSTFHLTWYADDLAGVERITALRR